KTWGWESAERITNQSTAEVSLRRSRRMMSWAFLSSARAPVRSASSWGVKSGGPLLRLREDWWNLPRRDPAVNGENERAGHEPQGNCRRKKQRSQDRNRGSQAKERGQGGELPQHVGRGAGN